MGAGALYLRTLSPTIGYSDSGELTAAAFRLGVNHSPSNPTYLLLAWISGGLFGGGDFAAGVNLLSALCGTAAAAAFFCFGRMVLKLAVHEAAVLAGALALSPLLWGQAVVAEVYLPGALLAGTLLALTLVDGTSRKAQWMFLAAGAGMGLHYSTILLLPSLVMHLASNEGKRKAGEFLRAGVFFAAGSSVMLYVMARAGKVPDVDFGHVASFGDFFRHVSWQQYGYRTAVPRGAADLAAQFGWLVWLAAREAHVFLIPAAAGAVSLFRQRRFAILVFGPVFLLAMAGLFNHPSYAMAAATARPKILPLVVWVYLLAAVGISSFPRRGLLFGLAAAGLALNLFFSWPAVNRSSNRVYEAWGEVLVAAAGDEPAALFVEGDIDVMPLLYLKEVHDRGKQLTVIDRAGLYFQDIYDYKEFPPELWDVVRARAEEKFIGRFPGRVFFTHHPGRLDGHQVVQHGVLYEVVRDGARAAGDAPLPEMPPEFGRWMERPEGLDFRERDIISRFLARMADHAEDEGGREELLYRSAAFSPENPIHLVRMARYLGAIGRKDEALGYFERAYRIAWSYEPAITGYIQALAEGGDLKGALEVTERFRLLDPDNPDTLRNLANLKRAAGEADEAAVLEREAESRRAEWKRLRDLHFSDD